MNLKPHFYASSLKRSVVYRATANSTPLDVLSHVAADHTAFECEGPVAVQLEVAGLTGCDRSACAGSQVHQADRHSGDCRARRIERSSPDGRKDHLLGHESSTNEENEAHNCKRPLEIN